MIIQVFDENRQIITTKGVFEKQPKLRRNQVGKIDNNFHKIDGDMTSIRKTTTKIGSARINEFMCARKRTPLST